MALYEITTDNFTPIAQTSFDQAGLRERSDLQRLLQKQIDVILPDTLVITEEFGEWDESKRRIDLLALDKDANLVVIELKRTEDGGHMELQAIRYAAMVSTMTFDRVVDVYSRYLIKTGSGENPQTTILEFLGWDAPDEESFGQDVKIVLVSANFSKELTTAVMWLNKRDLDISCIRVIPYQDNGRVLIDVQQIIPLPEAAEYQIQIREKEQRVRREQTENYPQNYEFWRSLIALGEGKTNLHDNIFPTRRDGICLRNLRGLKFNYVANHHDARVELYIEKANPIANKSIFDQIIEHKDEIETAFGDGLSWERLDNRKSSRIGYYFTGGVKSDVSEWQELQTKMVDAMIRLERAISPFIPK